MFETFRACFAWFCCCRGIRTEDEDDYEGQCLDVIVDSMCWSGEYEEEEEDSGRKKSEDAKDPAEIEPLVARTDLRRRPVSHDEDWDIL
jgi:hypothetical protein